MVNLTSGTSVLLQQNISPLLRSEVPSNHLGLAARIKDHRLFDKKGCFSVSSDGKTSAFADGQAVQVEREGKRMKIDEHFRSLRHTCVFPEGRYIAVASSNALHMYEIKIVEGLKPEIRDHGGPCFLENVLALSVTNDQKIMFVGARESDGRSVIHRFLFQDSKNGVAQHIIFDDFSFKESISALSCCEKPRQLIVGLATGEFVVLPFNARGIITSPIQRGELRKNTPITAMKVDSNSIIIGDQGGYIAEFPVQRKGHALPLKTDEVNGHGLRGAIKCFRFANEGKIETYH